MQTQNSNFRFKRVFIASKDKETEKSVIMRGRLASVCGSQEIDLYEHGWVRKGRNTV